MSQHVLDFSEKNHRLSLENMKFKKLENVKNIEHLKFTFSKKSEIWKTHVF